MPVGVYSLGGSNGRPTGQPYLLLNMKFTRKVVKTNDWYYTPGSSASWARRSKSGGKGNGAKIGVSRLGGKTS